MRSFAISVKVFIENLMSFQHEVDSFSSQVPVTSGELVLIILGL